MTASELSDRDREAARKAWKDANNSREIFDNMWLDVESVYLAGLLAGRERQRADTMTEAAEICRGVAMFTGATFPTSVCENCAMAIEARRDGTSWPPANRIEGRVDEGKGKS